MMQPHDTDFDPAELDDLATPAEAASYESFMAWADRMAWADIDIDAARGFAVDRHNTYEMNFCIDPTHPRCHHARRTMTEVAA